MTGPIADATVDSPVRIRAHPSLCAGWGNCHRFGPDVYPLDEHGHLDLHVVQVEGHLLEQAQRGAWSCPERAITVEVPR